ncbi:BspA family leucine-rich repeat surface protein [Candidatus Saccharibacteria bacterium]|nr:BspA family leucine-rich repeat surface protein [Candidatus Saccharibacteria bacterium]
MKSFGEAEFAQRSVAQVRNKANFFAGVIVFGLICLVAVLATLVYNGGLNSQALENGARVAEETELTYYLTVKADGVDKNGVQSNDNTRAEILSGQATVTDKLPAGLEFVGFITTANGSIGAVARDDATTTCSGEVIDDTQEAATDTGAWNADHSEYTYHGLHYNANTRTVSFRTAQIQAGCELTVGVVTKTPQLGAAQRMDFYNTANLSEGLLNLNSNTAHVWMGREKTPIYKVTYAYTGDVPAGAPAVPEEQSYSADLTVGVAAVPEVDGYVFSGWQTSDVVVSGDGFTMPSGDVAFVGSFTPKPAAQQYKVTYVIDGEVPEGYVVPREKTYEAGAIVTPDSTSAGLELGEYIFEGWTSSDVVLDENGFAMPTGDVVVHGSFKKKTYKVTYRFDSAVLPPNAESLLPATAEYPAGATVALAANPAAEGYRFLGWYANESFTMPAADVEIVGEWMRVAGLFSPEITIKITNEKEKFQVGDEVEFEIVVKNTAGYDIHDVFVKELLSGVELLPGGDYTIKSDTVVLIPTIDAGGTVTIKAKYVVTEETDEEIINTVEIQGAIADNNYLFDTSKEYRAATGFFVGSEEPSAPVTPVTPEGPGSVPEGTDGWSQFVGQVVNTLDDIDKYVAVVLAGIAGLGICVIVLRREVKQADITKRKLTAMAVADVVLIAVAGAMGAQLFAAEPSVIRDNTVVMTSEKVSYVNKEGGAWQMEKSAAWTGYGKATVTMDVDTVAKEPGESDTDVLFVVDASGSMTDNAKIERIKESLVDTIDRMRSQRERKIALVSFNITAQTVSGFTDDRDAVADAVYQLNAYGTTNYYLALKEVEQLLNEYDASTGRKVRVVFITDGCPNDDTPNEEALYRLIKEKYDFAYFSAVQFDMGDTIYDAVKAISDEQAAAQHVNFGKVLPNATFGDPAYYESFLLTDLVDNDHFTVENVFATVGSVAIDEVGGVPRISWTIDGMQLGDRAQLEIKLRLRDEYLGLGGQFPTNKGESVASKLPDGEDENVNSGLTPTLRADYTVSYEANAPADCVLSGVPSDAKSYAPYATVAIEEAAPVCTGYNFGGYVAFTDDGPVEMMNDDYFAMPQDDVVIRATWHKVGIEKTMDGTVHVVAKPAHFLSGAEFNLAIKRLANPDHESHFQINRTITNIVWSTAPPDASVTTAVVSADDSKTQILAWHDNNTIYLYTEAEEAYLAPDSSYMFYTLRNLENISGPAVWDSSNVTNMREMFSQDFELTNIDFLADWDTSNVTDMYKAFDSLYKLTDISGLANWDVSKVENMQETFHGVYRLTSIDALANWDTSSVTTMKGMFSNVRAITNVDALANWDVSKVKDMSSLFYASEEIADIRGLANWDVSSVVDMSGMFSGLIRLTDVNALSNWDVSKVENIARLFHCADSSSLADISGLANWNTSSVTNMTMTFAGSSNLTNIDALANWDTSKVTHMSSTFASVSNLTNLNALANWDTSSVTTMNTMFGYMYALTNVDGLANWNTSNVVNVGQMFVNDRNVVSFTALDGWDTSKMTAASKRTMFNGVPTTVPRPSWY